MFDNKGIKGPLLQVERLNSISALPSAANELCIISISTAPMVTIHRASIPSSARVLFPFLGEQTATIPAFRVHGAGEEEQEAPLFGLFTPSTRGPLLPLLERSACLGAIGQPINPEWKSSNGAAVVKGIRSTCARCGQAGLPSP